MPLRGLKVTFDSARTGMERVGSFFRWAAVMTVSATPMSFFFHDAACFSFLGSHVSSYFFPWGIRVCRESDLARAEGFDREEFLVVPVPRWCCR